MRTHHKHIHRPVHCRGSAAPAAFLFFLGLGIGAAAVALGGGRLDLSSVRLGGGGTAALLEIAALQVDTQRLASFAQDAAKGNFDAFEELQLTRKRIDERIASLRKGDPQLGIAQPKDAQASYLDRVARHWSGISDHARRISEREALVLGLVENAHDFNASATRLLNGLDALANTLNEKGAAGPQVHLVGQQMIRVIRMQGALGEILRGGAGAIVAADRFGRDAQHFGRVLNGMQLGNEDLRIARIDDDAGMKILIEIIHTYSEMEESIDEILMASTELFEIKEAADTIWVESQRMVDDAGALAATYR
jgi:twitching motility protein PilJ